MKLLPSLLFFAAIFVVAAKSNHIVSFMNGVRRLGLAQKPQDQPCESETKIEVKQCLASFYEGFGFNISDMPSASYFTGRLTEIIEKEGVENGIKKECTFANTLNSCLAAVKGSESCQNILSYESMLSVDDNEAGSYLFGNVQLEYQCANEKAYIDNYACMDHAWDEQFHHMLTCTIEYIAENWDHIDVCYSFAGWISCTEKYVAMTCGRQIHSFWCNMMELPIIALFPGCRAKMPGCDVRPMPPAKTFKISQILPKHLSGPLDYFRYTLV